MQTTPFTYQLEQEYQKKVDTQLECLKAAYSTRVQENHQRALVQTQKHHLAIKKFYADQEAKREKALAQNAFYVPAEPNFIVAVRIRGMNRVPPKPRKALDLLRLRKPNACVLLINNKSVRAQLQRVRNYIAFGYISYDLLRRLIIRRGFGQVDRKNNVIANLTNEVIEDYFEGDFFCLEDLVFNLFMGNRFADINRFLKPFALKCPRGGFKCKKKSRDYLDGGMCGDQGWEIGKLIERMID